MTVNQGAPYHHADCRSNVILSRANPEGIEPPSMCPNSSPNREYRARRGRLLALSMAHGTVSLQGCVSLDHPTNVDIVDVVLRRPSRDRRFSSRRHAAPP